MNDICCSEVLDLRAPEGSFSLVCKKGDSGRKIQLKFSDNGAPYTISNECYAVFTAKKPDGSILYNNCDITNNSIIYTFTPQTCAVSGVIPCEIKLYGTDGKLITSPAFPLIVKDTVYSDGDVVESANEISALTGLVSEATALIHDVEQKLADNAYADAHSAICYTAQTLNDEQQTQARTNISAAPAGYINGRYTVGTEDALTNALLEVINATDTFKTSHWIFSVIALNLSLQSNIWEITVYKLTDSTAKIVATTYNYVVSRTYNGETLSEWEWENPPMVLGMEYRTTERWNGKAVYVIAADMGALPSQAWKAFSPDTSASAIIACGGVTSSGIAFPVRGNSVVSGTFPDIEMYANTDITAWVYCNQDLSALTATLWFKYTKY